MAAAVVSNEDDETWLYGDHEQKTEEATEKSEPVEEADAIDPAEEKPIDKEAGELSGDEEAKAAEAMNGDEEEETDSDDDDDVQVTIGDIKTGSQIYDGPRNLFKGPGKYQKPGETAVFAKSTKGMDVDAPGEINGVSVFEFDLDNLQVQEKPWRKPGADITDYFNYGFNEETWQMYSDKQKRVRNEAMMGAPKVYIHHSSSSQSKMDKEGSQNSSVNAAVPTPGTTPIGWKAAPPPNRKMSGTIDVIGSTAKDSRRPASNMGEPIQVADSSDYRKSYGGGSSSGGSHIPTIDYSLPPPGVPPMGMSSLPPPPGMSIPPPGYPGSTDPYDTYYPPAPGSIPPADSHRSYAYDSSSAAYGYGTTPSVGHAHWDSRSGYSDRWEYGRERSPTHSETEYTSRDYYRERGRDRESSSTRDRTAREERHRVHGIKDERHRSHSKDRHYGSRRKHREDEDSDPHRAKHKRSKRSRKEKDEDGVDSAALSGADENVKGETTS